MHYRIIAVLDTIKDHLLPQSLELVAFVKNTGIITDALFILYGKDVRSEAVAISGRYGINIAVLESDAMYYPNPQLLMRGMEELMNESEPEIVCFTHTVRNCSVAAGLAALRVMSCITGIESCSSGAGGAIYHRSVFNGKLKETVKPLTRQHFITVIPGAYSGGPDETCGPGNASVRYITIGSGGPGYQPSELKSEPDTDTKLEDADVIISAGRGIGKPENLELVRETARLFNNSAIGASRPVCDNKWLPYRHQVGITGKTVSPKLYMALGISGSQQHIAGMRNSQCIVAVNRDTHAAIFSVADYIVVEDIEKFIPAFIAICHEKFGDGR